MFKQANFENRVFVTPEAGSQRYPVKLPESTGYLPCLLECFDLFDSADTAPSAHRAAVEGGSGGRESRRLQEVPVLQLTVDQPRAKDVARARRIHDLRDYVG